jgi:hypothetical protein
MDIFEDYVVLQGSNKHGEYKQVLVQKEQYETAGDAAADYFVGCPDAKKIGEVTLDGKLEGHYTLEVTFNSD